MFKTIIKNSDTYQTLKIEKESLQEKLNDSYDDCNKSSNRIRDLEKELEKMKSAGPRIVDEGKSCVIFEIDDDLNIVTKSEINKDVVNTLIDTGYIKSEYSEDFAMIQLAFILIANEVTEQLIEEVNDSENKLIG